MDYKQLHLFIVFDHWYNYLKIINSEKLCLIADGVIVYIK